MPRVHHVKSARKENPVCKAGEPYYWWKFRYGGKRYSLTYPKASQLTQSEFLGQMYDLTEQLEEFNAEDVGDLEMQVEGVSSDIRSLGSEQGEKVYGMPDSLQSSPTAELLQEREAACDAWADELDNVDFTVDEKPEEWDDEEDGEWTADRSLSDVVEEVQACNYEGE